MQNIPSSSAPDQQVSDIQNDPVIKKLFEDAIEVLRLAGADENTTGGQYSSSEHREPQLQQQGARKEKTKVQQKTAQQAKKQPEITKSKRRKLERIKAPVTVFRKTKQDAVSSEEEQERAVKMMLTYVDQMPSQKKFQAPPVPFVSLSVDESSIQYHDLAIQTCIETDCFNEDKPVSLESIQDYTYLSNERDVALWKMLVDSPTNCNVFVGGLSHDVTSDILHAAFKAFVLKEEDKDQLKAHVVIDVTRKMSKGYGFVTFPCRRSTELAMICMQDFEIHGRAMQLGWGQESREEKFSSKDSSVNRLSQQQHVQKSEKSKGNVVSDTVYSDAAELSSKQSLKKGSSRWDQETPKKYQRIEESAELDFTTSDPLQGSQGELLSCDNCQPLLPRTGERDNATLVNETINDKSDQKQRKCVQWLTHDQKVTLVKSVCSNLRACGVRGHLGVFGVYYEADNSRLYVVCAKHITESQLLDEFTVFGTAEVKLNSDANGCSKGCAFVQYTESHCAEKAIKQLHGKVVGGMPMKVMVAEPKVRKGSWAKKSATKL